ncbi:MAG: hypothetical protein ACLFWM_09125 [Actinomycetota bacterium]
MNAEGVERIHRHDVRLANLARSRMSLPESDSAIVTIPLGDPTPLQERGIAASLRASSVRVGFHLYNDERDVDALVDAVQMAGSG